MTARGAKFSEAIISRVPRWRPSSWSRTAAISGSSSASGWLLTEEEVLTEVGEVVTKSSWLGMGTAKVRLPAGALLRPLMTTIREWPGHWSERRAVPFRGDTTRPMTAHFQEAQGSTGDT